MELFTVNRYTIYKYTFPQSIQTIHYYVTGISRPSDMTPKKNLMIRTAKRRSLPIYKRIFVNENEKFKTLHSNSKSTSKIKMKSDRLPPAAATTMPQTQQRNQTPNLKTSHKSKPKTIMQQYQQTNLRNHLRSPFWVNNHLVKRPKSI